MATNNLERITLKTLEDDLVDPEYFDKVDVGGKVDVDIFSKSQRVEVQLPEYLRMKPLAELSVGDLHRLRGILFNGWQEEVKISKGDGQAHSSTVWATLASQ